MGIARVKQELLVRYLDAWTPAVLRGQKKVGFVCDSTPLATEALRVFTEFADLLANRTLTVVVPDEVTVPAVVRGQPTWSASIGPTLAVYDGTYSARVQHTEALAFLPEMADIGTRLQCRSWLVPEDEPTEALIFGTSTDKALDKFKDELWALDEYAGVRLRDPGDPSLLDISEQPNVGPLRRLAAEHVRQVGELTFGTLREWVVHETIYRAADATRAVQALVGTGEVIRTPVAGRLTVETLLSPSGPVPPS
jgi:hypothetical protein